MSEIDNFLNDDQPARKGSTKSEVDAFLEDSPPPARGFGGWARDIAATAVKGAIAVPEAVVGLADIPTGGAVGKFLENDGGAVGFRPKQAKEIVNDWHSDATKQAQQKFQEADGLGGKLQAAIENPSIIATSIGESLPSMAAGGVAARGLMAATRLGQMGAGGAALAGAAGEGLTMAGSAAEQIRQETDDGLLTPGQAALAGATGLVGAAVGAAGGKAAQKLGIGDVDTLVAQGARGLDQPVAGVVNPLLQQQAVKSIPKQVIQGAISEGFLEELPQSVAEQVFQNLALGKDWHQDVDAAIVLGTLSGAAMGGGAAGFKGAMDRRSPERAPSNPGTERVRQAYEQNLLALPAPQINVGPDGMAETAVDRNARLRRIQDGDILDVTPIPKRSEQMGLNPAAGPMSAAAATAVDTGLTDKLGADASAQAKAEADADTTGVPVIDYADLSDDDRAMVDDFYRRMDEETRDFIRMGVEEDDGVPDFDAPGNASTEDFLRALGASEQEIQDAISTTSAPAGPLQSAAGNGAAAQDAASRPQEGDGADQAAQGQSQGLTATPTATPGEPANGTQATEAVQAAPQGPAQQPAGQGVTPPRGILAKKAAADAARAAGSKTNEQAAQPTTSATTAKALEPAATGRTGVSGVDQPQPLGALSNVQNTQSSTAGTEAKASPVEARAPEGGNGAADTGVPAAGGNAGVRADGVDDLGPDTFAGSIKREMEARSAADERKARARKPSAPAEAQPEDVDSEVYRATSDGAGKFTLESDESTIAGNGDATPRKFASESDALAWAKENGFKTAAPGAGDVQADGVKAAAIAEAAHQAATSPKNDLPQPTEAQKEAGNYQKGHARIAGHDVTIENPAGSKRRPEWPALKNHYGYFKGSVGADKDHVDVFMTDRADDESLPVFVVDQTNKDGTFDEHKVIMGAADEADARATYLQNYEKGWTGLGAITQMSQEDFKAWVRDPAKTKKPVALKRGVLAKMADQKRQAALDRIAKGTAYFGTRDKADEFITKSGIGDMHEVVQAKAGRFEIRAKEAAAPAALSQPNPEKRPEASTDATPASQKAPAEPPKRKALLLRAVGQKMAEQGAADQSRDRNTNTARRASMAASADADARKREAMGKTLVNLADAIESGAATKLAGITTKAQVEALEKALVRGMVESERGLSYVDQQRQKGRAPNEQDVRNARFPKLSWSNGGADSARLLEAIKGKKGSKEVADMLRFGPPRAEQLAALKKLGVSDSVLQSGFGWWNIEMMAEVGRLERAGIKTDEDLRGAIAEYIEYRDGPKKEDPIKAAERKLIGQKVGLDFFPTPKAVADRMVEAAGIEPGMRVLEPSAGNGNLADAAKAAGAEVDAVEVSDALREVLSAKGYELVGRDFLSFEPTEKYDAIIMNPPFSNRLDAEHIQRAFGMLKPGGRLVAIAGEGVFNGIDKKAQAFRAWLDEVGASVEKLPASTFKDVQLLATTGANARLIEIEAPLNAGSEAVDSKPKDSVDATFSTIPEQPAQSVTVEKAQEVADKALSGLGLNGVISIRAFSKASDAGIATPDKVVPMGATSDGRIFLFAENLADELAVFRTVFHELFHLGLSKTVPQGAYIQTMLGFLTDPLVRQYANRWKQTADGVSRKETMPVNNWQALAVEEALSDIAEDMNADRDGTGTKYVAWAGRMAIRLAKMADGVGLKDVAERIRAFTRTEAEQFVQDVMRRAGDAGPVQLRGQRFNQSQAAAENEDDANFGTRERGEGSPADRAVMAMAGEGKSADEILRFIANASKSPFNRQVARLLRRTKANPSVSLGGDMGGGAGFRFLAKYSRKNHEVTLSEGAADRAEQIFLHETVHAATLLALDRGGDHAAQMQRLYESAKKQGEADGMYGMKNVGEFVAEAFTNPEFQKALKGMRAPGSTIWDRFVAAVRRILGLPDQSQDALSAALELGTEVMRENMPLRAAKSFRAEDAPAFAGVDQTETPAFRKWFGDSKVVDSAGRPLVVYHGTAIPKTAFRREGGGAGVGAYFTESKEVADEYADMDASVDGDDPITMQVYLSIKNPIVFKSGEQSQAISSAQRDEWEAAGYDGVKTEYKDGTEWVAFRPEQIKSATGNRGTFDPEDADIAHYGMADAASLKQSALDQIHQTLSHPGKVSVWDKTVGTMRNLAERSPAFKPVFEAAQRFIDDVSMLANETADVAPRLLPRVESWRDLTKKPVSAEDNQAISKPLFEGTLMWARDTDGKPVLVDDMAKKYANLSTEKRAKMLMAAGRLDDRVLRMWQGLPEEQFDALVNSRFESQMLKPGVVWADGELKSLFNLNDQQVSLYREARQAIDRSIDLTARADMLRALGAGYAGMRDAVLELPTLADARDLLVETLHADALDDSEQADRLTALINTIADRFEKATGLMKDGYAPLSRFGRYTVDVVDAEGQRQYFGMAESMRDANQLAERMRAEFPGATVTQGTMSAEAYKLFAGITPESLELFGNMLGLDAEGGDARDKAFQEYLRLTKNNHSALKRLMHRKGTAGYSEDVGRVLASFVYSNARQAAGGLNAGTMEEAVNAIPKEQGELKDVAMGLRDYVRDPQEEGQVVRGMLFAQYLGGSVASAFVNMTQPVAVTLPWLSQFGGMKSAGKHLASAFKDMAGRSKYEDDLQAALDRAEEDGIVSPQEIHQLMAQARGAGGLRSGDGTRVGDARAAVSNAWERTKVAWGQPFALAEQFNRRSTFVAAYRMAKERGMKAPAEFARRAVLETQFLYCVDEQTECLTTDGWKNRASLNVGDVVIGVDANGKATETPLLALHSFPGRHQVVEFSSANRFSMVVTDGHRHVVQNYNSRDKVWQKPMIRTTTELRDGHHLMRVPVSEVARSNGDADFAALLGWIAAEGTYAKFRNCKVKRNVRLVQSSSHNPEYVAEIEALLQRLGGHYRRFETPNSLTLFTLKKPLSTRVLEAMPEKLLTWAMVASMGVNEMRATLDAFSKGDGHKLEDGGWSIGQKQEQNLHVLQAMAVLCGQNATMYPATNRDAGKVAHLYLHTQGKRTMVKQLTRAATEVQDGVWCPETGTGTWVARRNGAVFVTGNSKANKPKWARGVVGGTLFTFKTYSVSYLELLNRMATAGKPGSPERAAGRRAVAWAMGTLMLMGGAGGLPFMEDLEDLIDGIAQLLGYNVSAKQWRREVLQDVVGKEMADFIDTGVSGLPGAPIDVSGRLGMGNLIPGTGLLLSKQNRERDLLEVVGPAGDLVSRGFTGARKALSGDIGGAALELSPAAVRNAAKGIDMAISDRYTDAKGYKVLDTTLPEAAAKAIGFQPRSVAKVQEANSFMLRSKSFYTQTSSEIKAQWARALFEKDDSALKDVRERLADWNRNNPDQPIVIKMPDVWKRVREMGKDRAQRIADTAPKALRQEMREMARGE